MRRYGIWIEKDDEEGFMMFAETEQVFWTTNRHVAEVQLDLALNYYPKAVIKEFRDEPLQIKVNISDGDIVKAVIKNVRDSHLNKLIPAN